MRWIFFIAAILGLDTIIKKKREQDRQEKTYLNGHVRITTYHNYGAFLNCGEKKPWLVKAISLSLVLVLTAAFVMTFTVYGSRQLRTALAILLGGAYSNTYDRIKRGYVVDYLNFPKIPTKIRNVVFNISDFCIVVGAYLIAIKQK